MKIKLTKEEAIDILVGHFEQALRLPLGSDLEVEIEEEEKDEGYDSYPDDIPF